MMSTEEILYSYHNAACRTKQIGILADLNACSRDEMLDEIDGKLAEAEKAKKSMKASITPSQTI